MKGGAMWVMGAALAVALAGAAFVAGASAPPAELRPVLLRVVRRIAKFEGEGSFEALNLNTDGAGLSFGFIQWTQKSGNLGKLLTAFRARDRVTFDAVVGGSAIADELLRVTNEPSLGPVAGESLWRGTWVPKFRVLGRHPAFQEVQLETALAGSHMAAALKVARLLGIETERGLALAFDRCVQQGEYGIPALARSLIASHGQLPYQEMLGRFGAAAIAKSGNRADVDRRVRALLADTQLTDAPYDTGGGVT